MNNKEIIERVQEYVDLTLADEEWLSSTITNVEITPKIKKLVSVKFIFNNGYGNEKYECLLDTKKNKIVSLKKIE